MGSCAPTRDDPAELSRSGPEPAVKHDDQEEVLARLGSASLGERGARPLPPRGHASGPGWGLGARALPVRCTPGDNLAVHVGVARAAAGTALVVDVGDVPGRGYFGEVLTTAAQARGIVGLVIDGGVRDVAALRELGFPVFACLVALPGAAT